MSIRGKLFHILLRYRHLLKGQLQREVITRSTSVEQQRKETDEAAARLMKPIEGIRYTAADLTEVYAEWVDTNGTPQDRAVLYFHGGSFVMGNAKSHRNLVGGFVKRLGVRALVFDYRLAPEHPAPAAAIDSTAVYRWLLKQGYESKNIVFAGDSAGGGVALSTLLKIKDDGLPLPAACAVFSPATDMTISGASQKTRAKADPCTPDGMTEIFLGYYVGDGNPKHPYASPLFGDLANLPPLMIHVGNDERLRDDSTRFAEKAQHAGVSVAIKVWKGMFHCFPLLAPMFPEATKALNETCYFLRQQLKLTE